MSKTYKPLVKSQSAARGFSHLTNFSYFFAGAILNSSMLAASAVHPASETAQIKGRLEVHLEMNTDKHEMTMGLFIKACINATCLFRKKVFDATTIPGKKRFELKKKCRNLKFFLLETIEYFPF